MEPLLELGRVMGGELLVAGGFRQVDDRPGAQPPVKMVVQENLRKGAEKGFTQFHRSDTPFSVKN
jgi:hypothetical protein